MTDVALIGKDGHTALCTVVKADTTCTEHTRTTLPINGGERDADPSWMVVNTETGELGGVYDIAPLREPKADERLYLSRTSVSPSLMTSLDQVQGWMEVALDQRKVKRDNSCKQIHDQVCGEAERTRSKPLITLPEYGKLSALADALTYRNFIIGDVESVCVAIGTTGKKVHRYLETLVEKGLVKVHTSRDGMSKGQMKVELHPHYGWVNQIDRFESTRLACVRAWTKQTVELVNIEPEKPVDPNLSPETLALYTAGKYLEYGLAVIEERKAQAAQIEEEVPEHHQMTEHDWAMYDAMVLDMNSYREYE